MKVSLKWLSEYIDLKGKSVEEIEEIFSLQLTEVEEKYPLTTATNMMIGKVLECVDHPDSDHLHICQVELANGEVSQIVCGAPNVRAGVKVLVALPGAILPGNFKIKPSKVRGVESNGMLCSFQELGIEEKFIEDEFKNGIYLLDDDAPVGEDPIKYLGLDDYVLDLHLTPNRADMLSMIGVSYDLGTVLNEKPVIKAPVLNCSSEANPVKVSLETDKVIQYNARYIKDVKIKKSPWWLRQRLIAAGIRPINNVVDITNYILIEYGQPLHAFDADKLGNNIVVRMANEGEKFTTLDEVERTLTADDIVITDGVNPVCLGGVMGGLDSEVTDSTVNVVLEAAQFNPTSIRKTSARLGLRSESSFRFERKVDYNRVSVALDKAAQMLAELADATVLDGVSSVVNEEYTPVIIDVALAKINSYMGVELTVEEVNDILDRMNFEYEFNSGMYHVVVPSRRIDYDNNYQDLIEDIARFYGFDNIPLTIPATSDKGHLTREQSLERSIKNLLAGLGMNEAICYSLTSDEHLYEFVNEEKEAVKVLMPFTEEKEYMRQSLIPSLLEVVSYNKARKIDSAKFFEISSVYYEGGSHRLLSAAFSGIYEKSLWQQKVEKVDFFLVKGIVEELLSKIGITATYEASSKKNMHPGKCASIKVGSTEIGYLGAIHPKYQKEHSLNETFVFELNYELLLSLSEEKIKYTPVSKYPSITRDLAIVCNKDINASEIAALIKQTGKKILVDVSLFDLYVDESIGLENKQLAYKLTFCDSEKTLESQDVEKVIKSILNRLEFTYQAKLRQ